MGQWFEWVLQDAFNGLVLVVIVGGIFLIAGVARLVSWIFHR